MTRWSTILRVLVVGSIVWVVAFFAVVQVARADPAAVDVSMIQVTVSAGASATVLAAPAAGTYHEIVSVTLRHAGAPAVANTVALYVGSSLFRVWEVGFPGNVHETETWLANFRTSGLVGATNSLSVGLTVTIVYEVITIPATTTTSTTTTTTVGPLSIDFSRFCDGLLSPSSTAATTSTTAPTTTGPDRRCATTVDGFRSDGLVLPVSAGLLVFCAFALLVMGFRYRRT